MKRALRELFIKPRWQHADSAIRAEAVAHSRDERLIQQLGDLARNDEAANVRLAALKRLTDLYPIMRVAAEESDDKVRNHARRMVQEMLAGTLPCSNSDHERLEIIPKLDDVALIEHLAQHAREIDIRRSLLDKIDRPGLLATIATEDSEPSVQDHAVSRIDKPATLERIAAIARKRDKRLLGVIQARLQALDPANDASRDDDQQAQLLCDRADRLIREPMTQPEKRDALEQLRADWQALSPASQSALSSRFMTSTTIVQASLEAPEDTAIGDAQVETFIASLSQNLSRPTDLQRSEQLLTELNDFMLANAEACEPHQASLDEARLSLINRRDQALKSQSPDAGLIRLCERLEQRAQSIDPRGLSRLENDWDQAWSSVLNPSGADQSLRDRFARLLKQVQARHGEEASAIESQVASLDEALSQLEQALEDGDLARAVRVKQDLLKRLETIGRHPVTDSMEFKARMQSKRGRLRELRDWQRWANNKHREALAEEAESIGQSGLHPDAMAEKVKSLQQAWKEMDKSEQLPGERTYNRERGALWKRFHDACQAAYTPAKAFFDKRSELRSEQEQALDALCDRVEQATASDSELSLKDRNQLVGEARRSLRLVSELKPSRRKAMAQRLRTVAQALDDSLEEQYSLNQSRKERLIAQLESLHETLSDETIEAAINSSKSLQQEWRNIGPARRNRDQALWKRFRSLNDDIFNRRKQEQQQQDAEKSEQSRQLFAILDRMKDDLDRCEDSEALKQLQQSYRAEWQAVQSDDRRMERIFRQQLEQFSERLLQLQSRTLKRARAQRITLYQALAAAHAAASLDDQTREQLSSLSESADCSALTQRLEQLLAGETFGDDSTRAQELIIALEWLAGVESPEAWRQQRMDYQVQRLSDHLSGESADKLSEFERILDDLWGCQISEASVWMSVGERIAIAATAFEAARS